jgi:hypothetical protein
MLSVHRRQRFDGSCTSIIKSHWKCCGYCWYVCTRARVAEFNEIFPVRCVALCARARVCVCVCVCVCTAIDGMQTSASALSAPIVDSPSATTQLCTQVSCGVCKCAEISLLCAYHRKGATGKDDSFVPMSRSAPGDALIPATPPGLDDVVRCACCVVHDADNQ